MRNKSLCLLAFAATVSSTVFALDVRVRNAAEFRAAVAAAKPGTRLVLAGGNYGGGFYFTGLCGEANNPIVIAAADPVQPPVFSGGKEGLHLSSPTYVELRDLTFTGLTDNGLNIDDGGKIDSAHHVVLQGLRVQKIGSSGNQDGIKLSGLTDFQISECIVERWGGSGSAIDLVGCQRGVIEGCVFRHDDSAGSSGVQCKGGSSAIAIQGNRFQYAGERAVNIGGSTGRPFFRPPLTAKVGNAEARDIRVEGNSFVGSLSPVAFVGVDGAVVRFNTFDRPGRWALRILQENRAPDFVACRGGVFTDNVVIFESTQWASGGVNIGPGTAPETFSFARNWWQCADAPDRSQPQLPTPEKDGVYGRDPAAASGKAGADAWLK